MTRRAVPLDRLTGLLGAEPGLTEPEAIARRERFGANAIVEVPRGRWPDLAADTARDPMLWCLGATGALYAAVGEVREAATLLVALVPLAGMDAFLHWRSRASTEGLQSRLAERAVVVRDGRRREVSALELVPGDLAVVAPGDFFPADGLIVSGTDLQADESTLTGEAYPVTKRPWPGPTGPGEAPLVDAVHWGHAGTRLLTGPALLRVAFTGPETIYGEIVRSAVRGRRTLTPLQAAIQRLVGRLVVAAAVVCLVLAGVRLGQGHGWLDALVSAVTLAVAALPEEFPVVFTFFLGVGVYRLARRRALVRRAASVENIGRVTAVCSDKTGTITEGRLRVAHLRPAPGVEERELLRLARLASRPESGDPLDLAVAAAAGPAGAGADGGGTVGTFPFTESRRRETVVVRDGQGGLVAVTKGAVEVVVAMCDVADAERRPVLAEAEASRAVARQVGLGRPIARLLTGEELEELAARGRSEVLRQVDVIARATPAQKLTLVRGPQRAGEIVAVTGGGVNDVPALQAADVGIAMGERGTRSAREVAAIVLLDDNFRTIVQAIREGRQLFANLRTSFQYLLMVHTPFVVAALAVPLLGYPLLFLPVHIVWVEMVIHPSALLVFQNPAGRLERGATSRRAVLFSPRDWLVIALGGAITTVAVLLAYLRSAGEPGGVEHGRAAALATLVLASGVLTAALSRLRTRAARLVSLGTVASAVSLVQVPALAHRLHLEPLHVEDWLLAAAAALLSAVRLGLGLRPRPGPREPAAARVGR
ncbi:MAG TPA: HAD-IC family P-type ATPase [Candidatus Binatia bacterium]|nr:HAD-IC family P-type ATPase [Candidatus Binatia bacterium]